MHHPLHALSTLAFALLGCELCSASAPQGVAPADSAVESALPSAMPSSTTHPSCRLLVTQRNDQRYRLSVEVTNPGLVSVELEYFHPPSFALEARVEGRRIEVRKPRFDHPVVPRVLRVEPQSTRVLETPITVEFASPSAPLGVSVQQWQLIHPPAVVQLRALRTFTDDAIVCDGRLFS